MNAQFRSACPLLLAVLLIAAMPTESFSAEASCYGISDARALAIARKNFQHMIESSAAAEAQSLSGFRPSYIQRDNYLKGRDGAVRILFSHPTKGAATYLEIFEDCSVEWREELNISDGVNGGSPWRRIGRTASQQ